jgi:hypothetical protein
VDDDNDDIDDTGSVVEGHPYGFSRNIVWRRFSVQEYVLDIIAGAGIVVLRASDKNVDVVEYDDVDDDEIMDGG